MTFTDTGNTRHDLSGCTIATLKAVVFDKCFLHRMQFVTVCQSFNGGNFFSFLHNGKRQAGKYPLAINMYSAGATLTMIASFLSSG